MSRAALLAAAVLLLAVIWWPTLRWPLARDQGAFAAVADVLNDGGELYGDALDLKPPVIYDLYALALRLHRGAAAIRVLDFALLAATLLVALWLFPRRRAKALGPLLALSLGISFFFLHGQWNAAVPDNFTALPVLTALLVRKCWGSRSTPLPHLSIGFLIAVALWLKFPAGIFLLLFPGLDLLEGRHRRRALWTRWLWMGVGFAGTCGLFALRFALQGNLRDLWEVEFAYVLHYAGFQPVQEGDLVLAGYNLSQLLRGLRIFAAWHPALVLLPLILAVINVLRRRWPHPEIWLAAALALLSVVAQRKFYLNHMGAVIPWLATLAALCLETLARQVRVRSRRQWGERAHRIAVTAALLLLILSPLGSSVFRDRWETLRAWAQIRADDPESFVAHQSRFGTHGVGDHSHRANLEVAEHVREHTDPDDKIFIWGFEPAVYFYSDRRSPSRFLFTAPLVSSPPELGWRAENLRSLQADPPALFLILREDDHWYLHGIPGDSATTLMTTNPELAEWVGRTYALETQIEHFTILRRK